MGKRSKERLTQELDQLVADEGLSDIPINSKSKKRKNKTSQDDTNPETSIGDENNCKKSSERQSLKKSKNPSNQIDSSALADQEVCKPKKQKKIDIEEHNSVNAESNDSLNNASRNKKKKKKRKIDVEKEDEATTGEFENITPLDIEETKRTKKHKAIPLDCKIEPSVNSDTDKLLRKKKRKIAVETAEETEPKDECLEVADVDNKTKQNKKKKKKHHLENQLDDILEKSNNNLIPTQESTNKEKKKKKNKVTESELGVDSASKKIKPVTAKFNAEEAAVTEEEINQFCDEIDEEDNKQYEDWVKLIEDMLGPKKRDVIES